MTGFRGGQSGIPGQFAALRPAMIVGVRPEAVTGAEERRVGTR